MTDIATLGLEIRSDGVVVASERLQRLKREGSQAEAATNSLSSAFDSLNKYLLAAQSAIAALGLGMMIKQAIDAQLQMDRLSKLFNAAAGSASLAAKEMEYVKNVTSRLGLDLLTTTESYGKFMAAIRGTTLEGEKGRKVFESVSGAAAALGLRADETAGIFNALQQMMSKGKVQAEELRGQLGERLPGAFKMAADAMGISTAQLDKNLALGTVMAEDLLPKLARQLELTYGKAALEGANSAQAAINRMNNAMLESKAVAGSALMPTFTSLVENVFTPLVRLIGLAVKGLQSMAAAAALVVNQFMGGLGDILSGRVFTKEGYQKSMADAAENQKIYAEQMAKIWGGPTSGDYTAAEMARQAGNKSVAPVGSKEEESKRKHAAEMQRRKEAEEASARYQLVLHEEAKANQEASDRYQLELQEQAKAHQKMSDLYQLELQNQARLHQEASDRYQLVLQDQAKAIAAEKELAALKFDNAQLEASLIEDPYERQKKYLTNYYEAERKLLNDSLKDAKNTAAEKAEIEKKLGLIKQKYDKDTAEVDKQSNLSRLAMVGMYTDMAGQMFSELASTQDQTSRDGFETAKAFNMAAAIMSTASAIIAQLAGPDGATPAAWARSVVAGVIGAIQVAKIAATSFGGGGSAPTVPAGAFSGGTGGFSVVGSGIGSRYNSLAESQSQEDMQRIASSMENASLALTKVADGLTDISDMFKEGGFLALAAGASPNIGTGLEKIRYNIIKDLLSLDVMHNITMFTNPMNFFKGVGSTLFGWGNKFQTVGGGFTLGLEGEDLITRDYIDQKKKGGWFTRSKNRTIYSDGDVAFEDSMQSAIYSIMATIGRGSVAMGTSANFGAAYLPEIRIATAGRKPEDVMKDMESWFKSASDALAKTVKGLQQFTFYGENAFDALVRLATALQSTNEGLELIGATLVKSTLEGANAAWKLQDLMGGAEKFTDAIDTYFQSMYSDEEQSAMKAAQAARQVNVAFAEMGLDAPTSRAGFRALVNGLDVSTESGAQLFAALMDVAEAFGTVQDYAEDSADALRELTEDAFQYSTNLMTEALEAAANQLRAQLDIAKSATSQLITLRGGNLTPSQNYLELKSAFGQAVTAGDSATILRLASQFASASRSYNGSGSSYQADYQMIESALVGLTGMEDTADLSLAALQAHSTYLDSIDKTLGNQTALMNTNNGRLSDLNATFAAYVGLQTEAKQSTEAAFASRLAAVSPAINALTGAGSVGGVANVISQMVSGNMANPFGFTQAHADLAAGVYAGTGSSSVFANAINSAISKYFEGDVDALAKFGVTPNLPTFGMPSSTAADQFFANGGGIASVAGTSGAWLRVGNFTTWGQPFKDMEASAHALLDPIYGASKVSSLVNGFWRGAADLYFGGNFSASAYESLWDQVAKGTLINGKIISDPWTPLPTFAAGGIATSPSIFGEAGPEAAVPLPDGRRIPVMLSGSADNRELVAEVKALRGELRASVRVQQAGFSGVIAVGEKQASSMREVANKTRLEAAA